MKLLLIHGAPATGKLTVARELSRLTNIALVDNHAAIDIARMVFGFAKPGFFLPNQNVLFHHISFQVPPQTRNQRFRNSRPKSNLSGCVP